MPTKYNNNNPDNIAAALGQSFTMAHIPNEAGLDILRICLDRDATISIEVPSERLISGMQKYADDLEEAFLKDGCTHDSFIEGVTRLLASAEANYAELKARGERNEKSSDTMH